METKTPGNKKWFIAFIAAAVVAVAAIVVAIVLAVTPKTLDTGATGEGLENAIYYYDVVDGEILLTFSDGNRFTIAGPSINKTGTYSVEGSNITLDFFKDEDGTTTATVNGDTVALVYDNATMSFQKKVNYTVTFSVDGGSEIAPSVVVNGKTVCQPADPTKDDCVFLGWYADAALTTPYDFGAVAVKADTTIYACWAAKQVGSPEFNIEFDLGYEGAEALAPVETIGGVAYGVATPERDGYTFGGWWISMYEDSEKLSYAYTAETVFTADTTLFAVWHDNSAIKLQTPAVSVSDATITWSAVKDAVSYKLTIVDPDGNLLIDKETVSATVKAFDFSGYKPGEYTVSVTAIAGNEANNSEASVRYFANKALDKVSGFNVVNGILIFGAVENAQNYIVTIDCGNENHGHVDFDNGCSTTYYIGNCPMQDGGILVTVTATANGYASSTSKVFVYNKVLEKIDRLVYDERNDQFVWTPVANTAGYMVTVAVDGEEYTFHNGTGTTFSIAGFSGDITVSVTPTTEGYNSPEAAVATCKKSAPAAPDGLTASGMVISWDPVAGASSYEVSIDGKNFTVSTNALNLSETTLTLTQGQLYGVKVKAVNANNESSSYSEEISVGYFAMDPALTYVRNTVYWAPVLGATQYQVRVNDGAILNVTENAYAKVVLTREGENLIEVRYISGDQTSEWASITVTACAVEYDTRSVAYGSFFTEYLAVGDVMSLPSTGFSYDGYEFTGWYNAPKGAAGNGKRYEEGTVFTGNAYTVVYAEWTPKKFNVMLNTDGFSIGNITNGQTESVTYTKDFTLPVPDVKNSGTYVFAGWYTGTHGTGVQITDSDGVSVTPCNFIRDITLYPFYSTDALRFVMQEDGTYGVFRGDTMDGVTELEIPATYKGKAVTRILESAFNHVSCHDLVSVRIPDTVTLVGASAFNACTNLKSIEVYKAKDGDYETFYSSENGVLIREDMGTTYLEFVPRAKTGDFVIPESVDKVLTRAFYYSSLDSVIIPNNVISIPKYAFYNCQSLKSVVFQSGRTNDIEIGEWAFYGCKTIESIEFPAKFNLSLENLSLVLDSIENLKSIFVENGGTTYASVGGMLTNKEKDTILYCPKAYAGAFTVPNGITSIGDKAFYNRQKITAITIPVWVTSVGNEAFAGCQSVKEIVFKGSRSEDLSIGSTAFGFCTGVNTITFEGNGTAELDAGKVTIGASAFCANYGTSSYTSLTAVNIGEGVNIAAIGSKAFHQQFKLRTVSFGEGVYVGSIGANAFEKCERLISFDVPSSVTKIDQYAFSQCTSLAAVHFDTENATTLEIANYAFNGCTKLGQILLPDHLREFKSAAFEGCDALKAILVNDTNPHYLNDENGILYKKNASNILSELLFYPKGLARELGGHVNNLPETLTTIGGSAFSANKYLISVTVPKTVTVIDVSAFANCENLTTIHFSSEGTGLTIGKNAFLNCESLDNIQLPAYTTYIGESAFENCTFTSFTVPAKVTVIGAAAFKNCKNLAQIHFNTTGALTIGVGAANGAAGTFSGCSALKTAALPSGLTELGEYAFYMCDGLESVTFGNVTKNADGSYTTDSKLTAIKLAAFWKCTSLKRIIIPKTVTTIGGSAFAMDANDPGSLEEVIFERYGTVQLIVGGSAFANQAKLKTITFPARTRYLYNTSVKATVTDSLEYYKVFLNNTSLAEINIDNDRLQGVSQYFTSIDGVLYNGSKTAVLFCPAANVGRYVNGKPTYELIIPSSVQTVMTYAFQNNTQLKTITFQEFDKSDANYGKQLLTIGNYVYTAAQDSAILNMYNGGEGCTLSAIGGKNGVSITTINLPSHLKKINTGAFANGSDTPITINFNPDADNIELERCAFVHCNAVALDIPGTLKSIGAHAFRECSLMVSASFFLPASTQKLPDNIFHGCKSLTGFELPAAITEIGQYAFYGCTSLKNFELREGIKILGRDAFSNAGLETVTIPASVSNDGLGVNLFSNCDSLTTVVFAKGSSGKSPITAIPQSMFYNCDNLVSINLEELNLRSIGNSAFNNCKKLADVDFTKMNSLSQIGTLAFSYTALTHVDLSRTQITALYNSFSNLSALKSFVFPKNITSVAMNSFINDTGLETVTLSANVTGSMVEQFKGLPVKFIVPSNSKYLTQDAFGVVYDPNFQNVYHAGGGTLDLTGYIMPETVMTISAYAFAYCRMDSLVIPEGVKTIGDYAFCYADIPVISVASTVETIGQRAFQHSGVEQMTFANEHRSQLKTLGQYAFECSALLSIVLPDNLSFTATSYYIFKDCTNLKSLTLGASMKIVPPNMVNGCTALEEIYIQEGTETIYNLFTFYNAVEKGKTNKVTEIVIPSTVQTLLDGAFAGFENLKTVTFAENGQLQSVGVAAFQNCFALESINLPASVTTLGKLAFCDCVSLQAMDLANTGITVIGDSTFKNTGSMVSLTLPNNLVTIGTMAFYATGAGELNIPATVVSIGSAAFENAANLKTVTFTADSMMESLGSLEEDSNIFKGTTSLETVTLPNFLKTVGNRVFENSGLREVLLTDASVPSDLQSIGEYAFASCANLTAFAHLGKVSSIGEAAFMNCAALSSAPLAEGLDYMGAMAFAFCDSLPTGYIPASVTELGGNPFAGMSADRIELTEGNAFFTAATDSNGVLTIYDTAKSIIYGVYGAAGEYQIDPDATALQAGALAGNEITAVVFPAKLKVDGDYLFANCSRLTSVTFNNEITSFGDYAFYQTPVSTIEIPASVTSFGDYAFAGCVELDHVTIPATVTSFGNYCFAYCAKLSDFTFEQSAVRKTLDTHFFYCCPNITQVILPDVFATTADDAVRNGQNSYNANGAIPSYMFAGTGIVNAVIPKSVTGMFTAGVFANCKDLELLTYVEAPATSSALNRLNMSWLDGCDKFRYAGAELLTDAWAYLPENLYISGIREVHVLNISFSNNFTAFHQYSRFNYVGAEMRVYFDSCTYQELIELFKDVANPWKLQIFDKDGYQVFSAEDNGSIVCVKDAGGNIVWEASEEAGA